MDEILKVRTAPLSAIIWDGREVEPGEEAIIDTFGYTYLTLYWEVDRGARLILEEVSRDKKSWRKVKEPIREFEYEGSDFIKLNEAMKNEPVLMYRFLKVRIEAEDTVKTTLEMTSKIIADMLPVREQVQLIKEQIQMIYPPGTIEVDLTPAIEILDKINVKAEEIYKRLDALNNRAKWKNDHTLVETAGTAKQLPPHEVADGHAVVVMALPTNGGDVYIGESKTNAESDKKRIPRDAGAIVELYVKNTKSIWVDVENGGEGVVFWFEEKES